MWQGLCAEWPRDQEPGSTMHHGGRAALLWQHSQWQTATPILGCTWLSFLLYSRVYAMVSNCMSAGYQQNKNLIKCIKSCQVNTQLSLTPHTPPSVELLVSEEPSQRSHQGTTANLFFHPNLSIFFRQWNISCVQLHSTYGKLETAFVATLHNNNTTEERDGAVTHKNVNSDV